MDISNEKTLGEILYDKRQKSFESTLDGIISEINRLLNKSNHKLDKSEVLQKISSTVKSTLTSEREVFITYLMNCIYDKKVPLSVKQTINNCELYNNILNSDEFQKKLLEFANDKNLRNRLTKNEILSHYFYEKSTVEATLHNFRTTFEKQKSYFLEELQKLRNRTSAQLVVNSETLVKNTDFELRLKLENLKLQVSLLEKENKTLSSTNRIGKIDYEDEKIDLIGRLRSTVRELDQERDEKSKLVRELVEKTDTLRDYYAIKSEVSDLQSEVDTKDKKIADLTSKLNEANTKISELIDSNEMLKAKVISIEKPKCTSDDTINQLEAKLVEFAELAKKYKRRITTLESELRQKDTDISNLEFKLIQSASNSSDNNAIKQTYEEKLSNAESQLKAKTAQIQKLRSELTDALSQVAEKTEIVHQLSKETEDQSRVIELTRAKNAEFESRILEKDLLENEHKQQIEDQKNKIFSNEDTQHKMQQQIDGYNEKMKRISSSRARYMEECKLLKEQLSRASEKYNEIVDIKKELERRVDDLSDENKTLTDSMRRLLGRTKKGDQSQDITDIINERNELEKQLIQAKIDIQREERKVSLLEETANSKDKECTRYANDLNKSRAEVIQLQDTINQLQVKHQRSVMKLKDENTTLEEQVKNFKNKLLTLENEHEKTMQKHDSSNDYYKNEIEKLMTSIDESRKAFSTQIGKLQEENMHLKSLLETKDESHTQLEEQFSIANSILNGEIKNLKEELLRVGNDLAEQKQNSEQLSSMLHDAREAQKVICKEANVDFAPLKGNFSLYSEKIVNKLKSLYKENDKTFQNNEDLKSNYDSEREKHQETKQNLSEVSAKLEEKTAELEVSEKNIYELKNEIADSKRKVDLIEKNYAVLVTENATNNRELEKHRNLLEEEKKKVSILEGQMRNLTEEFKNIYNKQKVTKKSVKQLTIDNEMHTLKIHTLESENLQYSNKIGKLTQENTILHDKLTEFEQELESCYEKIENMQKENMLLKNEFQFKTNETKGLTEQLNEQKSELDSILSLTHGKVIIKSISEVPSKIKELLDETEEYRAVQKNLSELFTYKDSDDMVSVIKNMSDSSKSLSAQVDSINNSLASLKMNSSSTPESVNFIVKLIRGIQDVVNNTELSNLLETVSMLKVEYEESRDKITQMIPLDNYRSVVSLFSKILTIVTENQQIAANLTFPISKEMENSLTNLFVTFKSDCESQKEQIKRIKAKARMHGYIEGDLGVAVDVIVQASVTEKERELISNQAKELLSLRDNQSKQSKLYEKTKNKLNDKIEELRKTLEDTNNANYEKASEFKENISKLEKNIRELEHDKGKLQRIVDELVRLHSGDHADMDLLAEVLGRSISSSLLK